VNGKGLGILYFLALEGPTRREVIADLLWGHHGSLQNLRVELHRLRKALAPYGPAFTAGEDPLRLPSFLAVEDEGHGEVALAGLEDLSSAFDAWLDGQRGMLFDRSSAATQRPELIADLAGKLHSSALVILKGQPGSGRSTFSRNLAHALGRPRIEGMQGNGRFLRYLQSPYPEGAETRILHDLESIWVIERPPFGEEPSLVLALLDSYPEDRTFEINLGPLAWGEARSVVLRDLPFAEAAQLFLRSGGNARYLTELVEDLRTGGPKDNQGAWHTRASFMREARFLSLEARLALERLSVHPGPLTAGLVEALGAQPYLDELERKAWLVFPDEGRFADESTRRAVYGSIQPGRRRHYHRDVATYFAEADEPLAEAHHTVAAGETPSWERILEALEDWTREALSHHLGTGGPRQTPEAGSYRLGSEIAPLDVIRGGSVVQRGSRMVFSRNPLESGADEVEWHLPPVECIVRLEGRAFLDPAFAIPTREACEPLVIETHSGARIVLASVGNPTAAGGYPMLPIDGEFHYLLHLPRGGTVRLFSRGESAVIEVDLSVFEANPGRGGDVVTAYELPDARPELQGSSPHLRLRK
jgi:hypothetical protein